MRIRTAAMGGSAALALLAATPAAASDRGWGKASSIGRDALVIAALGLPAARGDWRGDLQAGESLLAAGATTFALKELVRERRPDGSDRKSFPSGHTSISFAAAATLEKRYGWQFGFPALAVASFVGVARVRADKHYWHDAVAGAVIGGASGYLLTARHDGHVQLVPWVEHRGGGLSLAARF